MTKGPRVVAVSGGADGAEGGGGVVPWLMEEPLVVVMVAAELELLWWVLAWLAHFGWPGRRRITKSISREWRRWKGKIVEVVRGRDVVMYDPVAEKLVVWKVDDMNPMLPMDR
jgi:hypothetical protein